MPKLPIAYLCALYRILARIRREGLMAIEEDIERPAQSEIFAAYPELAQAPIHFAFMRDLLRVMVGGLLEPELVARYADTAERSFLAGNNPNIVLWRCIRATLEASLHGCAPQVAVEFGRQALPHDDRPDFDTMEQLLKNSRPAKVGADGKLPPLAQRVDAWFAQLDQSA